MALIQLESVTKAFFADRACTQAVIALDRIDLSVEEGEFVSLLGPSGCGKTVTLGLIAGFDRPTEGRVLFRGEPVEGPGPERGVVFQEYSLFPWLTVRGNIAYALRGRGLSRSRRLQAADDALARVGMAEFADRRPNLLSGGMKQRVAIARLLAMDSSVMLMDEPFSALDEQTRARLDDSLRQLWRREGKTVVFVTHSIAEAIAVSSRIVLLSAGPGRIVGQWSLPDDMPRDLDAPEVRALRDEIRSRLEVPDL